MARGSVKKTNSWKWSARIQGRFVNGFVWIFWTITRARHHVLLIKKPQLGVNPHYSTWTALHTDTRRHPGQLPEVKIKWHYHVCNNSLRVTPGTKYCDYPLPHVCFLVMGLRIWFTLFNPCLPPFLPLRHVQPILISCNWHAIRCCLPPPHTKYMPSLCPFQSTVSPTACAHKIDPEPVILFCTSKVFFESPVKLEGQV